MLYVFERNMYRPNIRTRNMSKLIRTISRTVNTKSLTMLRLE